MSVSFAPRRTRVAVHLLLAVHITVVMFPFVWMTYSTFKSNSKFLESVWALPTSLELSNYSEAWSGGALGGFIVNSLIVTVLSVTMIAVVAILAGYGLGIYGPRWATGFESGMVLAMATPAYIALVPLVTILDSFGLLDTFFGLSLPTAAFNVPISIIILRAYFVTIPVELLEAARIDGASEKAIFFRVGLPLARPAIFTVMIINTIWVWNDYLFPLVIINNPDKRTLPVGLTDYVGEHVTNYPVMLAAVLIASVGSFVFYGFFQRHIVSGLTAGAVK